MTKEKSRSSNLSLLLILTMDPSLSSFTYDRLKQAHFQDFLENLNLILYFILPNFLCIDIVPCWYAPWWFTHLPFPIYLNSKVIYAIHKFPKLPPIFFPCWSWVLYYTSSILFSTWTQPMCTSLDLAIYAHGKLSITSVILLKLATLNSMIMAQFFLPYYR